MRLRIVSSAALGFALAAAPSLADSSDEVAAQLRAMQERMGQLEEKLEATGDELAHANQRLAEQEAVLERAEEIDAATGSGVASFLETLEIGGWVSGSYFYNFQDPDGNSLMNANKGAVAAAPFQPDPNSFSFDQLWIELERPVSAENRAGFRADIVFGKTAGLLSADANARDGLAGNDLEIYQAYAQYLAPIGENGVTIKAGKFATLLGAEVVQAPYNWNVTRGQVYNLLQPITHAGVLAATNVAGLDFSLGLVDETRSFPASDVDLNKDKAILFGLAKSGDVFSFSFAGVHGAADSGQLADTPAGDKETILDVILRAKFSESFEAYVNADYIMSENSIAGSAGDLDGFGIAAATRYAFTERTAAALRGEYVGLDFDAPGVELELWTLTGTLEHKLAEQLLLRGELRYDAIADGGAAGDDLFFGDDGATLSEDDQLLGGVEIIYTF